MSEYESRSLFPLLGLGAAVVFYWWWNSTPAEKSVASTTPRVVSSRTTTMTPHADGMAANAASQQAGPPVHCVVCNIAPSQDQAVYKACVEKLNAYRNRYPHFGEFSGECDFTAEELAAHLCSSLSADDITVVDCAVLLGDNHRAVQMSWTHERIQMHGQCCGWGVPYPSNSVAGSGLALKHCIVRVKMPNEMLYFDPTSSQLSNGSLDIYVVQESSMQRHRTVTVSK